MFDDFLLQYIIVLCICVKAIVKRVKWRHLQLARPDFLQLPAKYARGEKRMFIRFSTLLTQAELIFWTNALRQISISFVYKLSRLKLGDLGYILFWNYEDTGWKHIICFPPEKNIASVNAFYVVYFNYCDGINFKFPEIIMSVISVGVGTTSIIQGHYGNVTAFWRLKSPATRPLVHASNKENIEVPYLRPFARPPPVTNGTDIFPNKFYWKFIFILVFRFYSKFFRVCQHF